MRVIVKARHMTLTEPLKTYAEEKLGNATMRILDKPASKMEIELSDLGAIRDGASKECKVTMSIPKGKPITICEIDDDMYKAIDLAHDRLLYQVRRAGEIQRGTTRMRKAAVRKRSQTARTSLTEPPETWESEVKEYERSMMGV